MKFSDYLTLCIDDVLAEVPSRVTFGVTQRFKNRVGVFAAHRAGCHHGEGDFIFIEADLGRIFFVVFFLKKIIAGKADNDQAV